MDSALQDRIAWNRLPPTPISVDHCRLAFPANRPPRSDLRFRLSHSVIRNLHFAICNPLPLRDSVSCSLRAAGWPWAVARPGLPQIRTCIH
jgi:hypothetical protein